MPTDILTEDLFSIFETNEVGDALRMLTDLRTSQKYGAATTAEDQAEMKNIEKQLEAVAMVSLTEGELIEDIESSFDQWLFLPDSVDLINNLRARLLKQDFVEDRNALRAKIKAAIERSVARLGVKTLLLGTEEVSPTIANWIRLYISEVGAGSPSTVKMARFFAQNRSVQLLTQPEKDALKRLINFYEFTKLRSDSLQGNEETLYSEDENGDLFLISDGKVEKIDTKLDAKMVQIYKEMIREGYMPRDTALDLIATYPKEFAEFRGTIQEEDTVPADQVQQRTQDFFTRQSQQYAKLMHVSGVPLPNRTAALVAMLHKAVSRGQEADLILAREILQYVVADQDRFINFMRHTSIIKLIQDEFPKALGEKNKPVVKESPASPMALQALLSIVFSKFKITPEEVAWHSFEVLQKVPLDLRDFKTLVTYDVRQDQLAWRY